MRQDRSNHKNVGKWIRDGLQRSGCETVAHVACQRLPDWREGLTEPSSETEDLVMISAPVVITGRSSLPWPWLTRRCPLPGTVDPHHLK